MKDFVEELKNIPEELCINCGKCCKSSGCKFPNSLWEKLPDGCGYEGWIFKKREELKQKVRKQKELLLDLEVLLVSASKNEKKQIYQKVAEIDKFVKQYDKYGSVDW